jgi:alpha-N-acetylglucosamine transferase
MRFGPNVVSVVRLERDQAGKLTPVVLHETKTKKTKKSKGVMGIADRAIRRLAKAEVAFANSYLDRHEQSNQDERDGWIKDLPVNVIRAQRKGWKQLKVSRLLPL